MISFLWNVTIMKKKNILWRDLPQPKDKPATLMKQDQRNNILTCVHSFTACYHVVQIITAFQHDHSNFKLMSEQLLNSHSSPELLPTLTTTWCSGEPLPVPRNLVSVTGSQSGSYHSGCFPRQCVLIECFNQCSSWSIITRFWSGTGQDLSLAFALVFPLLGKLFPCSLHGGSHLSSGLNFRITSWRGAICNHFV